MRSILVVDDDPIVRAVAQAALCRLPHDIVMACDGLQAVEQVKAHNGSIALVLLDYVMPRMNGEDAFYAIRSLSPSVPIVLSSSHSTTEAEARMRHHGLDACLPKPYSMGQLTDLVTRLVSGGPGQNADAAAGAPTH